MPDALDSLRGVIGGEVIAPAEAGSRYGGDASHLRGEPLGGVRPRDAADVVRLVGWARTHRVALVARGGGSSLDGESVPVRGSVVVDFSGWDRVLEIAADDRVAVVGPGVVNRDLHRALAPHGLFFPPNPGSWTVSTLGGNVATNASGPRSFKYGTTRNWVSALVVVLGTGELVQLGGRTTKRSTGPDLLSLFIGSEGILGLTTEVTVRLAVRPARRTGIIVPLPPESRIGPVARAIARWPLRGLSAVEYLDRACADALAAEAPGRIPPDRAALLLEIESGDEDEETRVLADVLDRLRGLGLTEEPLVLADADEMWTLRGQSGLALDREMGERIREDVAVPLSRLDELVALVEQVGHRHGTRVATFGHVGDGNLHPNYAIDPTLPGADLLRRDLLTGTRQLAGTISAEHGIGALKAPHLGLELEAPAIQLLRDVKRACDPDGLLNPGKVLPPVDRERA
ncbi:MAG TPA: FAD-binding oxidoreductase [Thermoplasmata archaeon]|nr:FAD-binding oxidoreductase [Thermoplasmata archaeon]